MTARMVADSLRGQERKITEFQQSTIIDGHEDDLESSRGFKCLVPFLWKERNMKCSLIRFSPKPLQLFIIIAIITDFV